MAGKSGFAITISAVDQTTGPLDAINKRLARLNAPAERFNKALAKFGDTSGISRVSEGIRDLGAGAADTFRNLDRLSSPLAAITGAGSIAGMIALTRRWAEFGNQVGNVAYSMNLPVERLGNLRGAARLAGASAADLDAGMRGLGQTLSAATYGRDPHALQLFRQLNVEFEDGHHNARQAADVLGDVADAIQKLPDARTKVRVLNELGIGEGMLPLLKNGRKGLEDYRKQAEQTGGSMTGQMVKNATEMNTAWQRLGLDFEGVGNRIVDSWSGTVTKVLANSSRWIEANKKLTDNIAQIGAGILALGALKPAAWVLRLLGLGAIVDAAPFVGAGAALAGGGYLAGQAEVPMVDEYGRVIGNWGGRDESKNPAYVNPLGPLPNAPSWGWLGHPAAGRSTAITVPKGPTNSAATMRRVHDYFRAKGLSEEQTAGILANVAAESGFNPSSVGDGGTSYGLFQHHAGRLAAMQTRYGTAHPTEQQQLDFAWDELNGPERGTLDRLRSVGTAGQAGAVFAGYERPADGPGEAMRRGQASEQFVQRDTGAPDAPYPKPGDRVPGYFAAPDGAPGASGNVHVEVTLKGAPAGTTAKVTSSGAVTAPPARIEMPLPGVN